jgi:hypothetical protein
VAQRSHKQIDRRTRHYKGVNEQGIRHYLSFGAIIPARNDECPVSRYAPFFIFCGFKVFQKKFVSLQLENQTLLLRKSPQALWE